MKKMFACFLTGLLVLGSVGSMVASAAEETSVYVEYGAGGSGKLEAIASGNSVFDFEATEFTQFAAGINIPLSNWKLGLDYQSTGEPQRFSDQLQNADMTAESDTLLVNVGYQVLQRERLQLWINGSYLANEIKLTGDNNPGLMKYTTDAFLIGPEFNYYLNARWQLQGNIGYAVSGSQESYTVANGSVDCSNLKVLFYGVKLNYDLTDNFALGVGYRSKVIESKLTKLNGCDFDMDFSDTQNVITVGATYKF